MTYTYISELPPQVRELLSIERQEQWLSVWNASLNEHSDEAAAYNTAWQTVLEDAYPGEITASGMPDFSPGPKVSITINAKEPEAKIPTYSFVSSVEGLKFETKDGFTESWIQVLPLGKYHHAVYGDIDITPERVARFAANVNNNVRGTQLDVDYEHKENPAMGGRAAGWIVQAEDRGSQGLWAKVRWTPDGEKAVKNGEYRYFSPEFADSWKHPKSNQEFEDVLFGGGITNRPFLKDILPLNLSEVVSELKAPTKKNPHEGREMKFFDDLFKALGLGENATEEQVLEAVSKIQTTASAQEEALKKARETLGLDEKADLTAQVKTLHEFYLDKNKDNERAKKFAELFPEEAKQLAESARKLKESEVEKKLADWTKNPNSKLGIPVKLHDDIKNYRMELDSDDATKFDAILDKIVEVGTVSFSENGTSETGGETENTDAGQFLAEVAKLMEAEDNKLSFKDAVRKATEAHPKLAEAYANNQPVVASESAGGE